MKSRNQLHCNFPFLYCSLNKETTYDVLNSYSDLRMAQTTHSTSYSTVLVCLVALKHCAREKIVCHCFITNSHTLNTVCTITEKSSVAFSLGGVNLKRYFDQR